LWFITFILLVRLASIPTTGKVVFNTRFLIYFFGIFSLYFFYKITKEIHELSFNYFFPFFSLFFLILASMVEVYHYFHYSNYRNLGYSYVLVFYSTIFFVYGFRYNSLKSRKIGVILTLLVIAKFYFYDIWNFSLIIKIIAGFSLGAGLVLVGLFYEKFKNKILGEKE
jgi:hypothetical protein